MPLVLNDRVQQIATANTTVSFTLGSSVTGFQSFAVIGNGNTTYYSAFDSSGNWEVGLGTYATIGPTLTRNSIFSSSNSNAAVTFIGNVNVFVTYPSSKSVYGDGTTLVSPSGTILPVVSGGTGVTTSTGTGSVVLSASPTLTGTVLIGSTSGTSTVTLGRSSNTSTVNINTGSSTLIATRTVNIATNGSGTDIVNIGRITASDGETTINIGTQVRSNNQTYVNINTGAIGGNAYTTIGSDDGGSLTTINGPFYASGDSNYQILLGSTTSTGPITIGQSTDTQTTDIQAGATASGRTKTINIGTGGLAGSTTAITVGATTGTSVTANGTWTYSTPLAATNMVQATTSTSGYLSSTDWNTFNSKGSGSVTSVTATSPVTSTGGVTPIIAMPAATTTVDGYLTSTDWTTFNNKGSGSVTSVGGTGSVNGVTLTGTVTTSGNLTLGGTLSGIGNSSLTNSSITINGTPVSLGGSVTTPQGTITSVTGTSPIASSGGTTPAISIAQADTSTSGFLSSTDWNTFNSKGSGSVTSVGGTGTVSGISLSGTVTSSGDLTLGGALDLSSPPTIGNTTPNTGAFTSVTTPSVTATTTDLTLSAISTGAVNLNTAGGTQFKASNTASATNYLTVSGSNGGAPALYASGASGSIAVNIASKGTNGVAFYTNGSVLQQVVSHTASAVNYAQVTGNITSNAPILSAQGSDTNISMSIRSKGSGTINFDNVNAGSGFRVSAPIGASTQYLQATGSASAFAPILSSQGTDTNISMAFQPKGTGAIDLAAGSRGVNISNGGTVTAITRTQGGSGYTTAITGTVSAPTTAGGTTATVNVGTGAITVAIAGGGTGYTVGDVLTMVGGTNYGTAQGVTVSTVSAGVITGITISSFGNYSVLPTNPVSVTGGTGTGATFNLSNFSMTYVAVNSAGSGYIEQPTVTFSGGGGSNAAAYATVGSGTTLRSLGSTLSLNTTGGEQVRILDNGQSTVNYIQLFGASAGSGPQIQFTGSDASVVGVFNAKGPSGAYLFATNNTGQFRVQHTASAVNFVQVTGAATGNGPTISAQGSDATAQLNLTGKGGAGVVIFNNGTSTPITFSTTPTASAVNYFDVTNAVTGAGPLLSALGTDANIDIRLQTKGTGAIKFSTAGGLQAQINDATTAGPYTLLARGSSNTQKITAFGTANLALQSTGGGTISLRTGDETNTQLNIGHTASAVNRVDITGSTTGNAPVLSVSGSDANIELRLVPKGTSGIALMDSAGLTAIRAVQRATSGDTFLDVQRAVGFVDLIATSGVADSDIRFTPKGAGRVRFGTYTASVLTPTGYIEVKDSGGTLRRLLVG